MKKTVVKSNKTFTDLYKSIRGDWGNFNPVMRVKPSKTQYNRSKEKQQLRQQIQAYM